MIEYRVRSVSLLNLVNDIRAQQLIPNAYFQRNLVWRDLHKKDFIKTILLGLPFPQIFISQGKVNVESMSSVSWLVDGQQRMDAIMSFIDGKFEVDGDYYSDLDERGKSDFLKYEIAVIELALENDDPKINEIFRRINRTANSLTTIEKLASEYSTSYFMLVAKLLADQIELDLAGEDDYREDPNIPAEYYVWAKSKNIKKFVQLANKKGIFSQRELSRKVHLMHVLNIMSTVLVGFYNRNDKAVQNLNDYVYEFPHRDYLVDTLEKSAAVVIEMKFKARSYWLNKANIFSLLVTLSVDPEKTDRLDILKFKSYLEKFESETPADYKLAAKEGVNSTKARQLRHSYIDELLNECLHEI